VTNEQRNESIKNLKKLLEMRRGSQLSNDEPKAIPTLSNERREEIIKKLRMTKLVRQSFIEDPDDSSDNNVSVQLSTP
jgi:ribosome recycling factor